MDVVNEGVEDLRRKYCTLIYTNYVSAGHEGRGSLNSHHPTPLTGPSCALPVGPGLGRALCRGQSPATRTGAMEPGRPGGLPGAGGEGGSTASSWKRVLALSGARSMQARTEASLAEEGLVCEREGEGREVGPEGQQAQGPKVRSPWLRPAPAGRREPWRHLSRVVSKCEVWKDGSSRLPQEPAGRSRGREGELVAEADRLWPQPGRGSQQRSVRPRGW